MLYNISSREYKALNLLAFLYFYIVKHQHSVILEQTAKIDTPCYLSCISPLAHTYLKLRICTFNRIFN